MQDHNNRWGLVAKKLAGEASAEECKKLQDMLDDDPYLTALMLDLSNLWGTSVSSGSTVAVPGKNSFENYA